MFAAVVLATVCLASSTVLAAYDKPFYEVEDAESLFKDFVQEHKKVYNRREYHERLEIFKKTLKEINERNAKFPDTVFAVNHFADLYPHELEQYTGFKLPKNITSVVLPDGPTPTATEFDWRDKHVVSHVKHQGYCGSCYIFSAVGDIEGQYALKHKQCLSFSEGQVLDCLGEKWGCQGGWMHEVMQELAKKKEKLEKEPDYPYHDAKSTCKEDASKGVALVTGGTVIKIADEEELKNKLVNLGPLAVALNALDFYDYKGGILEPDKCKGKQLNHGVLLVGYGEENGKKFWIIKNSWGDGWGEKGYVRLLRGVNACVMGTSYTAHSQVA
ncbi:procathepsin L-like [Cydia fagiglandana]|uniref:procathepsin L-like n=1 Tax=Cydia fagiglandana TaxID=1458189 RepID=UPI002FEE2A24